MSLKNAGTKSVTKWLTGNLTEGHCKWSYSLASSNVGPLGGGSHQV